MKLRFVLFFLAIMAFGAGVQAQVARDSSLLLPKEKLKVWQNAKFGMFIHWGLYSIQGRGEWAMFNERQDIDEYAKLKDEFTGEKFNADEWVKIAADAGCKYMVMTAKHHDGFALFDSKAGGFNSMLSPAKKDFIKEYALACQKMGMLTGIYYSPLDWRYPGFFFPTMYRRNAEEMKQQTYTQVRELMSNYGNIDILWYDGGEDSWLGHGGLETGPNGWQKRSKDKPYTGAFTWDPVKLNRMVRSLQSSIVINPRSGWMGDFDTHEVRIREKDIRKDLPWEYCTMIAGVWGWQKRGTVMPLDSCIRTLAGVVCRGGNMLLNVGPNGKGEIEPAQVARLREIGAWMKVNGESVYGTEEGPFEYSRSWGGSTKTDKNVYLHITRMPEGGVLVLPPALTKKIRSVVALASGKKIKYKQTKEQIRMEGLDKVAYVSDLVLKIGF